ncbi:uncharacterized protein LOC131289807 [Anopheles ziemanni]|uniref:uncharacterized protein LOC131271123 n=1 Tax=Anopheles coustani TaxID=139045 RepID=UPI0026590979|nr:uncharacterized protein LOC131271123 [Anopheles coustani]XP_058175123.1 uncharacterized protein LOC131289807 [Anopheles ziemanni]
MEIPPEEWIERAKESMKKFLNRGGASRGDEPQSLCGAALQNTLGYALNLTMKDPNHWTDEELQLEYMEQLCFYDEESCKTIDKLTQQIYGQGVMPEEPCHLTILPIELYAEGKLYEVALFRYQFGVLEASEPKYVDSYGRVYGSFRDFLRNNKYPSAEMMYPKDGRLKADEEKLVEYEIGKTPAWKAYYFKALDIATGIIGIAGATGAIFLSGGIATPFVAASIGSALYATGRSLDVLRDKSAHQESLNPFRDSESRTAWLSLTAHVLTFGTMPHISALSGVASTSHSIATGFKVCNFINETGNIISDLVICDTLSAMHSNYYNASIETRLAHAASICFWTKTVISIRQAELMMKNNAIVALKLFGFEDHFCDYFNNDSRAIDIGLRIVKHSLESNVLIASDPDDHSAIRIDGIRFSMKALLACEPNEVEVLFDILLGISTAADRELFEEVRSLALPKNGEDEQLSVLIHFLSKEAENESLPVGEMMEMLLQTYASVRRCEKIALIGATTFSLSVVNGIHVGQGLCMSLKPSYILFASKRSHEPSNGNEMTAASDSENDRQTDRLLRVVLELSAEQCARLTEVIRDDPNYMSFFKQKSTSKTNVSTMAKEQSVKEEDQEQLLYDKLKEDILKAFETENI